MRTRRRSTRKIIETGTFTEIYKYARQRGVDTRKFKTRALLEKHLSNKYPYLTFDVGETGKYGVIELDDSACDYKFQRGVSTAKVHRSTRKYDEADLAAMVVEEALGNKYGDSKDDADEEGDDDGDGVDNDEESSDDANTDAFSTPSKPPKASSLRGSPRAARAHSGKGSSGPTLQLVVVMMMRQPTNTDTMMVMN